MSRNAQTPEAEDPLLPPLTISQTLTRVSLLACFGVGTIMFLKSRMVARQHLSRTTKVAETIANCHRQATERLIRENERGVARIVEALREERMRGMGGGSGPLFQAAEKKFYGKADGVRFDDEYGKWNGYSSRNEGGRIGFKVDGMRSKDKYPSHGFGRQDAKAEGVRFQDHYGL